MVPVLRNVETMNFADIELAINELGVKVCTHHKNGHVYECL